ncbi:MAG: hypothetical protein P1U41_02930 [Vicingaceae bacterium]|nr:hypothetical protein [Vicingaceae bacterium]
MRYIKNYILLLFVGIIFSTCSKEKFEAQVPTYITINDISLSTNYATEGSSSENITDAWVYVNDELMGVYELPATFPVLIEGNVELKVFAGIKDNGIAASRARYLMFDPYVESVNLIPGETIEVEPSVTYNSGVNFRWLEDFENASLSFLYHQLSDTIFFKNTSNRKEGDFSGKAYLESSMNFFEATSVAFSDIPRSLSPTYLELDFKTNEPLLVGIYHNDDQYGVVSLNTSTEWKKIYINLTDVVSSRQSATAIKVFFGIQETTNDPFLTDNPEIHIDNIKLLHY